MHEQARAAAKFITSVLSSNCLDALSACFGGSSDPITAMRGSALLRSGSLCDSHAVCRAA